MTRDRGVAARLARSGSRAPGSTASSPSPRTATYQPGKRAMIKVKHARTADCVVAGFRWHKSGRRRRRLAAARPLRRQRARCTTSASPRRSRWRRARSWPRSSRRCATNALDDHPWREWATAGARHRHACRAGRAAGAPGKDLSWEPLRIERVCEVKYDHLQGDRFRHAAVFLRWRPDKPPQDCRYDQLEVTTPYELEKVFGAGRRSALTLPSPRRRRRDRAAPARAAARRARAAG